MRRQRRWRRWQTATATLRWQNQHQTNMVVCTATLKLCATATVPVIRNCLIVFEVTNSIRFRLLRFLIRHKNTKRVLWMRTSLPDRNVLHWWSTSTYISATVVATAAVCVEWIGMEFIIDETKRAKKKLHFDRANAWLVLLLDVIRIINYYYIFFSLRCIRIVVETNKYLFLSNNRLCFIDHFVRMSYSNRIIEFNC